MANLSIEHNVLASTQNRLTTDFIPRCLSSHHTHNTAIYSIG